MKTNPKFDIPRKLFCSFMTSNDRWIIDIQSTNNKFQLKIISWKSEMNRIMIKK